LFSFLFAKRKEKKAWWIKEDGIQVIFSGEYSQVAFLFVV